MEKYRFVDVISIVRGFDEERDYFYEVKIDVDGFEISFNTPDYENVKYMIDFFEKRARKHFNEE